MMLWFDVMDFNDPCHLLYLCASSDESRKINTFGSWRSCLTFGFVSSLPLLPEAGPCVDVVCSGANTMSCSSFMLPRGSTLDSVPLLLSFLLKVTGSPSSSSSSSSAFCFLSVSTSLTLRVSSRTRSISTKSNWICSKLETHTHTETMRLSLSARSSQTRVQSGFSPGLSSSSHFSVVSGWRTKDTLPWDKCTLIKTLHLGLKFNEWSK